MVSNLHSEEIRQAAIWLERMQSSSSSAEEFEAWQGWLSENAQHSAAFAQVREFWRAAGELSSPGWPTADDLRQDRYDGTESVDQWRRRADMHADVGTLAWIRRHCTWPWRWRRRI